MRDSARVVHAYAAPLGLRSGQSFWDYSTESPLADARGFLMSRHSADLSQLTHLPELQPDAEYLANVVLPNGARYYVDHAHPEYSAPETTSPREALRYDRAGDQIAAASVRALAGTAEPVNLYKNNTDGKGASYGTHENYLVPREVDFEALIAGLTPFFVTRQIYTGAGRVGLGQGSEEPGFQLSSRADFFEAEVGLETTLRRPIINTRDEPHAIPEEHRRLHVIIGDANLAETAGLLKLGATSLVLGLIEHGRAPELALADPLGSLRAVSRDLDFTALLPLAGGGAMTAIAIQREYLRAAEEWCRDTGAEDPDTVEVLQEWARVLHALETDPVSLADSLDWAAKYQLLSRYREREGLSWDAPKLALIDVQYADVRPERGLFHRLESSGAIRRLTDPAAVDRAMALPPEDTRAWLRGTVAGRFSQDLVSASWDSLVFQFEGEDRLHRLPMLRPERGTRALVGDIVEASADARELLRRLTG